MDNWLFFDPTDETLELGELPWVLRGGTVMLGVQQDSVLYRLPYPEPQDFRRVYRAEAQLNTDGSFSADVNIIDFGGFASGTRYINRVISTNEQIDDWRLLISEVIPDVKLENYNTGDNGDSAWASFTIRGESIIQRAGALILLRPDFFHAAESSPLTAKERQHPVWFGPPVEIETHITWQLPDSWNAEIDTAAFESRCDAASIFSKMSLSGSTLHCLCIERKSGRLMWPEYYEAAQKFSKDLSFAKGQTVLINNQ